MVIHDETRIQAWKQETEKQQQKKKRPQIHLSVVAVQCIACGVILLLTLLLRVAGGDAYDTLRYQFGQALARNELMTALSYVWNDAPMEQVERTEEVDVKVKDFTDEETAQLMGSSAVLSAAPPLESGTLTSRYGERVHPISGKEEVHKGVDIAAPAGAALMAMYDGTVVEVGENDGLGRYVRLSHGGGIEVLYGHCERVTAQQGNTVKAGETVALVGSTGVSTGNHVHLSVSVDGVSCDPEALVSLKRYA